MFKRNSNLKNSTAVINTSIHLDSIVVQKANQLSVFGLI